MDDYIKVGVNSYVKEGLECGLLVPQEAEKYARIIARPGIEGEAIISWSVDEFGNEIKEKVAQVKRDEVTNKPGWVAIKASEEGKPIIDANGHKNEWIIDDSVFKKKYESVEGNPGLFKPKGGKQTFVQIPDNIILNQWGSDMKIAEGGYINITNVDDMYGISKRDFEDTYEFTSLNAKEKEAERSR